MERRSMTGPRLRTLLVMCAFIACAHTACAGEVAALPKDKWPDTADAAVPLLLQRLTPSQKYIIKDTDKGSLRELQDEWGEDIETFVGLGSGNTRLREGICGSNCSDEQATFKLMEAVWEALRR